MNEKFNQWKNDYGLEFEPNYSKETEADCKASYEAGQQSRQAEIDELQKRIDEAVRAMEQSKPLMMRQYDAMQALNILKGKKDE